MTQDIKTRVVIKPIGKTIVTLPNLEFDGDTLEITPNETLVVDYKQLKARIKDLTEREEKLVAALKYYADPAGYKDGIIYVKREDVPPRMDYNNPNTTYTELKYTFDKGDIARAALKELNIEK